VTPGARHRAPRLEGRESSALGACLAWAIDNNLDSPQGRLRRDAINTRLIAFQSLN
jgi:hypothetical protein